MTKVITFGNFKGGVGKTMTSVMTALDLSKDGKKVLFIDFDPQGNGSDVLAKTFNINYLDKPTIFEGLEKGELTKSIHVLDDNISIIPSDISLVGFQFLLSDLTKNDYSKRAYYLDALIEPIKKDYDFIIIDTPPTNRLPIITKVIDYEKEEIKTAILKELSRDGQVFYIYNEVINMEAKKKELKEMLPDFVKIEYVHGKLVPKEIKDKIKRFEAGEFDILLASTIIENGIDISNVNTMIIENFDKLGLSQVYQLRGRVGRSNRQGYCYLLKNTRSTKKGKQKQESIDKIEGIKSGGFQISMEDLKIRGAGEILGDRQHGTIETFGYDLYIKMLNEEIQKQKGTYKERIENVQIIINNRGSIPETYISGEERLSIYKRFAMLETFDELRELIKEVQDRFGKIIGEVEKFVKYIELKIIAKDNGISLIKEDKKEYELIFEKTISQEFSNMVSLEENESIDEETGEVVYIQKITIEKSKLNEYIETLKVDY